MEADRVWKAPGAVHLPPDLPTPVGNPGPPSTARDFHSSHSLGGKDHKHMYLYILEGGMAALACRPRNSVHAGWLGHADEDLLGLARRQDRELGAVDPLTSRHSHPITA